MNMSYKLDQLDVPRLAKNPIKDAILKGSDGLYGLTGRYPETRDSAGIIKLINQYLALGIGGIVLYEDAPYTINIDMPLYSNISHIGVPPKLDFTTNIPDATSVSGGTRFNQAAGVTGFYYNNIDVLTANQASPSAPTACANIEIAYITFIGGKSAINTGATNAMGLVYSHVHDLYAYNTTGESFNYENYQHLDVGNHIIRHNGPIGDGSTRGGIFFRCSMDKAAPSGNVLIPGNSTIYGEIYTLGGVRQTRHIVFETTNGSQTNEVHVTGRMQSNRYGAAATIAITCNVVAASPDITVPDNAQFAECQVGMPITFMSGAVNPLAQYVNYWVYSRNATNNTIQVSSVPLGTFGIVINVTATVVGTVGGYPGLEVHADGTSLFTNCNFGDYDLEMYFNTVSASFWRVRQCKVGIYEFFASQTKHALVVRDSNLTVDILKIESLGRCDYDGLGQLLINNKMASTGTLTAGRTLLATDHQTTINYNSASAGTFTVPGDMLPWFTCNFVQMGAGQVVIVAGGGATVTSRSGGLKSAGIDSQMTLRQKSLSTSTYASTYALTGNVQITASAALDFPSIAAGASADLNITATGASVNQNVELGLPAAPTAGLVYQAFISAANTATVRATNITAAAIDPVSQTFSVSVS